MILRRLAQSIRQQDWFAVVVETMIVVLGVFLGLQVNNWNTARQAAQEETALLVQMHDAFAADIEDSELSLEFQDEAIEALRYILRTIQTGEEPEDREAFLNALVKTGSAHGYVFEAPIVTVLIASGDLTELSSAELRQSVVDYRNLVIVLQQQSADTRMLLTNLENGAERGLYLNPDVTSGEATFYDFDFAEVSAQREFYQNLLMRTRSSRHMIEEIISLTQTIIDEIEVAQK